MPMLWSPLLRGWIILSILLIKCNFVPQQPFYPLPPLAPPHDTCLFPGRLNPRRSRCKKPAGVRRCLKRASKSAPDLRRGGRGQDCPRVHREGPCPGRLGDVLRPHRHRGYKAQLSTAHRCLRTSCPPGDPGDLCPGRSPGLPRQDRGHGRSGPRTDHRRCRRPAGRVCGRQ